MMRTIKLLIEYDGTNYLGWQVQPKGSTLQGVLEEKLSTLTGEKIDLLGSGRTDAGVHALGQVAHFKTKSQLDVQTIQRALNSLLPSDILIQKVEEVDEGFHARRSSKSKVYEYRVLNRHLRSVFHRGYAWHIPQTLNIREMKKATRSLMGEHDFSSFQSVGSPKKTEIEANGFLKQMVRAIVGTLIEVGKGKINSDQFQKILDSRDRKKAGPTAPAHGLFLKEVKY